MCPGCDEAFPGSTGYHTWNVERTGPWYLVSPPSWDHLDGKFVARARSGDCYQKPECDGVHLKVQ